MTSPLTLPHHPDLDHLKKQAKQLLRDVRAKGLERARAFSFSRLAQERIAAVQAALAQR